PHGRGYGRGEGRRRRADRYSRFEPPGDLPGASSVSRGRIDPWTRREHELFPGTARARSAERTSGLLLDLAQRVPAGADEVALLHRGLELLVRRAAHRGLVLRLDHARLEVRNRALRRRPEVADGHCGLLANAVVRVVLHDEDGGGHAVAAGQGAEAADSADALERVLAPHELVRLLVLRVVLALLLPLLLRLAHLLFGEGLARRDRLLHAVDVLLETGVAPAALGRLLHVLLGGAEVLLEEIRPGNPVLRLSRELGLDLDRLLEGGDRLVPALGVRVGPAEAERGLLLLGVDLERLLVGGDGLRRLGRLHVAVDPAEVDPRRRVLVAGCGRDLLELRHPRVVLAGDPHEEAEVGAVLRVPGVQLHRLL